jgi:serine/threonine protein kinase
MSTIDLRQSFGKTAQGNESPVGFGTLSDSKKTELDQNAAQEQAAAPESANGGLPVTPSQPENATIAPTARATTGPVHHSGAPVPADEGANIRYFGNYQLLEEVARGGMGVVYKARQTSLNRIVALKMILSGELASDDDVRRFQAEAEAAANLDHPGIVPIYEVGEHEGQHYFAMGFVEGESLADKIQGGPVLAMKAAEYTREVGEAIAFAHQHGVIHRDLKPANVLLDKSDRPKVTDFGLAKKIDDESGLTATGQVLGTPSYMPPEQAAGQIDQISERSDIYSLGAVLYALLTGRPPFQAATHLDTLMDVLERDPLSPRLIDRRIPRDLETICLKAMAKAPAQRYQDATTLVEDLRRFEAGEPVLARRPGPLYHALRFIGRHRKIALAVAITASLLLLIAPWLFDRSATDLHAWGDERHESGDHSGAVDVYRRALRKATGAERETILNSLYRCAREIGSDRAAVEAAQQLLEGDPGMTIDNFNLLMARALISEVRSASANRVMRDAPDEVLPLLELASRQLTQFLDGLDGPSDKRDEASELLRMVDEALASRRR